MIDAERVAFVQQAFRVVDASDTTIKARNDDAVLYRIDTNLDGVGDAQNRANQELASLRNVRVIEVEVDAIIWLNDFVGGPPSYNVTSASRQLSNKLMKVVWCSPDLNTGTTILRLRG